MTVLTQRQALNVAEVETALPLAEVRHLFSDAERIIRALHYEPDPLEVRYGRPLPVQLVNRYAMVAALRADTERLGDGTWYAEIRGLPGVWAQGTSEVEALREIETVVRDWTLLKIQDKDRDLPVIGMIDLNVL